MTTPILTLADELMALAGNATPGEWRAGIPGNFNVYAPDNMGPLSGPLTGTFYGPRRAENRDYIAACNPTNITALCNAVKELSEENERLREAANDLLSVLDCDGPETADESDQDSVGWNGDGPLKMTFGHIRRLHALAAGEKT